MKALGDASGANVYAPMTWGCGSASLFKNGRAVFNTIPKDYKANLRYIKERENSLFMDQYKRYNPNARCWEEKFTILKGGRFQSNGTLKF